MVYQARITVETGWVEGMLDFFSDLPDIAAEEARPIFETGSAGLLDDLRYYPPSPSYPEGEFPWTSDRQRIKVVIKLRQLAIMHGRYTLGKDGGIVVPDLRYERTFDFQDSWKVFPTLERGQIRVDVSTDFPAARFVVGDPNQRSLAEAADPQQGFHADRWTLAAASVRFWFDGMVSDYRAAMTDRFGDAVKVSARRRTRR